MIGLMLLLLPLGVTNILFYNNILNIVGIFFINKNGMQCAH